MKRQKKLRKIRETLEEGCGGLGGGGGLVSGEWDELQKIGRCEDVSNAQTLTSEIENDHSWYYMVNKCLYFSNSITSMASGHPKHKLWRKLAQK